jgi:hypothetical protein
MYKDLNKIVLISIIFGIVITILLNIYGIGINNREMQNNRSGQAVVDLSSINYSSKNSKISGYVIFNENIKEKNTLIKLNIKGLPKNTEIKWKIDKYDSKNINPMSMILLTNNEGNVRNLEKIDGLLVSDNNSIIGRTFTIYNKDRVIGNGVIGYMNTENRDIKD